MTVQKYDTRYGTIYVSTPGPYRAYENMRTYRISDAQVLYLQGPALRAFKRAEELFTRPRFERRGKLEHIKFTGHGYRSWDLQNSLWLGDKDRYADPDKSFHVEALAVDLDQNQSRLTAAQDAMKRAGFRWGLEFGDRPHWSFYLLG